MKTSTFIMLAVLALVAVFGFLYLFYGEPEVAFKPVDEVLYLKIKNGFVGMDCYNESGQKIIAPSRFFGYEWMPYASLAQCTTLHAYSISCYPYDGSAPITAVYPLR
jgi:uncharacterized membrane protein YqiK